MTTTFRNTPLTWMVTALACLAAHPVLAQFTPEPTPIPGVWGPNSNVRDSVVVGDTLFLGGDFDYVGPSTSAFATTDTADGASMVVAQTPLRDTIAAASDGAGGWFVASRRVGSRHLVHLRADGSPDPSFTTPTLAGTAPFDDVRGVVAAGGRLYLFGSFSSVNGQPRRGIVALDPASGNVLPWDAQVAFSQASPYNYANVTRAAVDGNILYIVGLFDSAGGQPRSGMAAFDLDTGSLRTTTFAGVRGSDAFQLSAAGGRVYVGGSCSPTPTTYAYVCGFASDGTPLPGWAVSLGSDYYGTLLATPTRVYIAGTVSFAGPGNNQSRVRGFDPVTGSPDGWQSARIGDLAPGAYGSADAMVTLGGQLFVSGYLTSAAGVRRPRFAAFDLATGAVTPWHPAVSGAAIALVTDGTRIALLGGFNSAGGRNARHIAALDLRTGSPAAVPLPAIASPVNAFAASGSLVVAGAASEVIAFNAASGAVQTRFDVSAPTAPPGTVSALAIAEPLLFVGGNFADVLGQPRQHLAAIDMRTGQPTAFDPRPNGQVSRLRVSSGALYAVGPFTSVPGYGRGGVAAWDIATGALEAFNPPLQYVLDIAFFRDRVFLAGSFGGANPAVGTAWVDRITGAPVALGRPAPFTAFTAARTGNTLLAGGTPSPGWSTAGIVAVDGVTGTALPWQPVIESRGLGSQVAHLNATATAVVASGLFDAVAGVPVHNLAIFRTGLAASPRQMTAAVSNGTVTLGWQPGGGPFARSYVLEAGTTAGASDVGVFAVGAVTRVTGVLAPGTYFVRVRGVGDTGPGPAGSEVIVTVPSTSTPPAAPGPLTASVSSGVVTLSWGAAAGNATSYVVEAGTAAGLTNIGALPTGNLDTSWSVPAPPGTYVVRVRAANAYGLGPASNEVAVVVP